VRELRHGEATQIAHDLEDMLVHGVHVVQVVLHLAHDAAKGGNVAAEDAVLVHPPQLPDEPGIAQDGHEAGPVHRIPAKGGIDAPARAPQRPQRARPHAFELVMLLQQREALEDCPRFALEQVLGRRLQ
jgi:hypothetical protein